MYRYGRYRNGTVVKMLSIVAVKISKISLYFKSTL